MNCIDLHIHTTASDGTDPPRAAVEKAASLGLAAVSITDHDSVSGVPEAMRAGAELGVEGVPGIDWAEKYPESVKALHDAGHEVMSHSNHHDHYNALTADQVVADVTACNEKIAAMFERDGFDISIAQLREEYPDSVLGRPHFCEHLMRKGYISSVKEGFEKYLGEGKPYYLPKRRISIAKAVETIVAAGGVPVLAHPMQYHYPEPELIELIETAKALGIRALEAYYSEFSAEQTAWLLRAAEKYGMGVSGGSDYHGTRKTHISMGTGCGNLAIPYSVLEKLKKLR